MTELQTNPSIGEDLVKSLSQLLHDAGVQSVLWGDYLLTIYGVPSIIGGIEFVVPDEKISAAVAALKKSHLQKCPDPGSCIVSGDSAQSPWPVFHMHIGTTEVDVSIRAHSETLWFITPPSDHHLECPSETQDPSRPPHYVLASDSGVLPGPRSGRGHGRFSDEGPHVLIPASHVLLEAYLRLAIAHRQDFGLFYLSMITYVEEYIDRDGLLDDAFLSEPCRVFWHAMKAGHEPMGTLLNSLQAGLDGDMPEVKLSEEGK
ncbi:hypothetical protein F4779DRAFT_626890 [Xylariaceae sp. FL0662B]|nr:hypothetical protein F4779DRAFT_626890 [Xylariaceae sp. FL0662B]